LAVNIGGIASKLGNGYEADWVIRQLLDVARGEAQWLRFEGIASSFLGFEAAVARGSQIEWHQTKIHAPNGSWTVAALESVLTAFAKRLSASPADRCIFVSQDPARVVRAMTDKARIANDGAELVGLLSKHPRPRSNASQTEVHLAVGSRLQATFPIPTYSGLSRSFRNFARLCFAFGCAERSALSR